MAINGPSKFIFFLFRAKIRQHFLVHKLAFSIHEIGLAALLTLRDPRGLWPRDELPLLLFEILVIIESAQFSGKTASLLKLVYFRLLVHAHLRSHDRSILLRARGLADYGAD